MDDRQLNFDEFRESFSGGDCERFRIDFEELWKT